ncbi:MAM and LDL-receptor class A domain-containing protein 1-like [Glandiceps talaboti]
MDGKSVFLAGILTLLCISGTLSQFDCTFESDLCGWIQSSNDDFDWTRQQGETSSPHTGPPRDHTIGDNGWYVYIENDSPQSKGDVAHLVSPDISMVANQPQCLSFWYHMYGTHVADLNVYLQDGNTLGPPIWTKRGTRGNMWLNAQINIMTTTDDIRQVVIEGVHGYNVHGDIAIDDVIMNTGYCNSGDICDFEDNTLCGGSQDNTDDVDWSLSDGGNPVMDHTYGSVTGHYLSVAATAAIEGNMARFISATYTDGIKCLQFYYNNDGDDIATLNVYSRISGNLGNPLWSRNSQQGDGWRIGQVTIDSSSNYQIVFEAVHGSAVNGYLAIDDYFIADGACQNPGDCDFETGLCTWSNDQDNDQTEWEMMKGPTGTSNTGPDYDHTYGNENGTYIYTESSNTDGGSIAQLVSEPFMASPGNDRCLEFWYSMYGSGIGNVLVEQVSGSTTTMLWSLAGNQGNAWNLARVGVKQYQDYQLIITSRRKGNKGDIGVDDIVISEGYCTGMPAQVPCTFENDTCGWTQSLNDDFDWVRQQGEVDSPNSGPSGDHTIGTNGTYMYIGDGTPDEGEVAQIISANVFMKANHPKCFTFWYHMYGSQIGELSVYLLTRSTLSDVIWNKKSTHGNVWRQAQVNIIAPTDDDHQVVIEAVHGSNLHGEIAIDDIGIIDDYCDSGNLCDFEDDTLCGVTQDSSDDIDWTLSDGNSLSLPSDHTYGTKAGHYLYIQNGNIGDKARFISATYTASSDSKCLQFYYNNDGDDDIATLNVYSSISGNLGNPLWSRNSQQGDGWRIGQVTIDSSSDYQIVFEAVRGSAVNGYLAIDDYMLMDGDCYDPGECDFENGLCGWSNDLVNDDVDWTLNKGSTSTTKTGPDFDHTLGNEYGTYLYSEVSNAGVNQALFRLISEPFTAVPNTYKCLEFWYHMKGTGTGTLVVEQVVGVTRTVVWSLTSEQGDDWLFGRVGLSQSADHQIVFSYTRDGSSKGDAAIDDIAFTGGSCTVLPDDALPTGLPTTPSVTTPAPPTNPPIPIGPDNCDFESGTCDWSQVATDDFDWTRWTGETGSAGTGPSADHTTGSGYYMYMEATGSLVGDKAQLISTPVISSQDTCFHFWYHMYGSHMGTLNVYVTSNITALGSPLWTRTGMQGNVWRYTAFTVSTRDQFQIVFEAIVGESYGSDIAIDDVMLDFGVCPQVTPSPGAPVVNCNFESSYVACGYSQEYVTDDFDWTESSGSTSSTGTGPSVDHTTGTSTGIYLYIETSQPRVSGDNAMLYTATYPYYINSTGTCVQFWYHMYGSSIGDLNVYSKVNNQMSNVLWNRNGDFGDRWNLGLVSVATTDNYQIVFEGLTGSNSYGDIALDDVSVNDGSCGALGECTFEKVSCTWTNVQSTDDFDWIVGSGSTSTSGTGPSIDHTTGSSAGKYLYVEASSPRRPGEVARFTSIIFDATSSSGHCLIFWYHMNGADIGTLRVLIKEQNGYEQIVWQLSGDYGDIWLEGQVGITTNGFYEVYFEGIIGNDYLGDMSLDDISFTNSYCGVSPIGATPTLVPTLPSPAATTVTGPTVVPLPFDCDFENDTCGWTQGTSDDFDWTRSSGGTSSIDTGPSFDHTKGDSTGFYMFIETSAPRVAGEVSHLYSPEVVPVSGSKCMKFWYHMYGQHVDALHVYVETGPSLTTPVWTKTGTQGDIWLEGQIDITTLNRFKVVFEGVVGPSYQGDVAIDDVSIIDGDCPPSNTPPSSQLCTFESSTICNYTQDNSDTFDWTWDNAGTPSSATGPSVDHTYGTTAGYYVFIEASPPRVAGDAARLETPVQSATGNYSCVEFWYHMYGLNIGTLNIYVKKNGQLGNAEWTGSTSLGDQWNLGEFTYSADLPYQIVFEGVVGASYDSDIAIDDVLIKDTACSPPGSCDFESGKCTWTEDQSSDDFDWVRQSGATSSLDTGPSYDHTLRTSAGYYVFIETSSPRVIGEEAHFVSEYLDASPVSGTCLHFWYHMYGTSVNTLRVMVRPVSGTDMVIWELTGDKGDQWFEGQARIDSTVQYQVLFIGIVGSSYTSDIALDDISFDTVTCPTLPSDAVPITTTVLPSTQLVPTVPPAVTGFDCDFETGANCSWVQATDDEFDWTRLQGSTGSVGTGPAFDHTTGSGFYIYIETSSTVVYDKARVISPYISSSATRCLRFWYHMYGANVGSLNVYFKINSQQGNAIWTRKGTQGNQWIEGLVTITANSAEYVVFEGVAGTSFEGDIALDDISLQNGLCPSSSTTPPYRDCNFEDNTLCGWTQSGNDDFDWTRDNAGTPTANTGPSVDHTYRTTSGHYMYSDMSGPQVQGDVALLISPTYTPLSTSQCFHFWYHMYGSDMGSMNVYAKSPTSDQLGLPLWTVSNDQGDVWQFARVDVDMSSDFQVVIEGVKGSGIEGDIAIDDVNLQTTPCPEPGECDFEIDNCDWTNLLTDDFDWIRLSGSTTSTSTGPSVDHTTGTAQGYYLYVETSSPRIPGEVTQVSSELLSATSSNGRCLHFWYHMYGATIGTLRVMVQTSSDKIIWELSGDNGDFWNDGQIAVYSDVQFRIIFEGVVGSSFTGDIAIDDISFTEGYCAAKPSYAHPPTSSPSTIPIPSLIDCDFEGGGVCTSWSQASDDDFDWTWSTGSSPSLDTGPSVDHTTGTDQGGYVFIETSSPRVAGDTARIQSVIVSNTGSQCLEFWYHMYGPDVNTLNVYIQQNGNRGSPVWSRKGTHGDVWHYAYYNVPYLTNFQVVFEGVRGLDFHGDIAVDDITLSDGICSVPATLDCDFEDDHICGYDQDTSDDFDWTRGSGSTLSNNTGPSYDHTYGTDQGYYMYMEASSPRVAGDVARLMTAVHTATPGQCLEFWYHMYGSNVGTLNIYTKSGNQYGAVLWSIQGDQGDTWWDAQVTISSISSYQVVFEAIVGGSYSSDIAIDDVQISDGACQTAGDCNFEGADTCTWRSNLCSWSQASDDDFDWTWSTGSSPSVDTGPSFDHTTGTDQGGYVFIEASSPRVENDTARIESVAVSNAGSQCLEFWYHMYGPDVNTLNVYIQQNGNRGSPVWSRKGTHGDVWHYAYYNVPTLTNFQVVFEGVRGLDYRGDIAVDDVTLSDGICSVPATIDCDFEDDHICGYDQDTSDDFDWTRGSGSTLSNNTGPSYDHTYGTDQGYYMYMEASSPRVAGDVARLMTTDHAATTGQCLEFWYHMYGSNVGTLNIYAKSGNQYGAVLWSQQGDQGDIWWDAQVNITSTSSYQVVFEAIVGGSYSSDIAIDDIQISDGVCPTPGDCNFEGADTCTWSNTASGDDFDWLLGQGATASLYTGPSVDHTLGTDQGHCLFIETSSPRVQGDVALFESKRFMATDSTGQCLHFWYHMFGAHIGTLNVWLWKDTGSQTIVWTESSDMGDVWNAAEVGIISSDSSYQVVFEGIRGSDYEGDIAIDDIYFITGSCSSPIDCDFEGGGVCTSWSQASDDDFDWTWSTGSSPSSNTGPSVDHTTGTDQGGYVFIEASSPRVDGDTARIESIAVSNTRSQCLEFWYHMYGPDVNTLNVYIQQNGTRGSPVWSRKGTHGDVWHYAYYNVPTLTNFQVVFEGVRGIDFQGDIAVDDITLSDGICSVPATIDCDFEDDHICGYDQDTSDDFDWTRGSGSTLSNNTGPSYDHTYGTDQGYYMYMEASSPRVAGDVARLMTTVHAATTGQCLEFWYHMYGSNVGTLNIYAKSGDQYGAVLWSQQGDQGDIWWDVQVTITSTSSYQVVFEAIVGGSYSSDIAIDDIQISDGACQIPGNCNFEGGNTCTWTNTASGDDFDWLLGQGSTDSSFTGPSVDHTLGTDQGYYMFIETSSPQVQGDIAYLESQQFTATDSRGLCLHFWYHMYGAHIGSLNVWLKKSSTNQEMIWSDSGDKGDVWNEGTVSVKSTVSSYQIMFEGVTGSNYLGDIGVDDISFLAGPCNSVPTTIDCDFEGGTICLSWSQASNDDFDWTWSMGSSPSTNTGPSVDHTTGTDQGGYVFIEASSPRVENDTARIESMTVSNTGSQCLEFWYHMYGPDVNTLNVYIQQNGNRGSPVWSRKGTHGDVWHYAYYNVPVLENFQVVFEGVRGLDYRGDIAVDDIALSDGICSVPATIDCDFEDDHICGYDQDTSDDFDWTRGSGSTLSNNTGPSYDHTYGTDQGYYMYMEASSPRVAGDVARLMTTVHAATTGQCLEFWYHMYGSNVGTLNIYAKSGDQYGAVLWSLQGDQGDTWWDAQVTITSTSSYQVVFEAIVGGSYSSDIAIDDVQISDGVCQLTSNCTFESASTCGWRNIDTGDDSDWMLGQGSSGSPYTGPSVDHTLGTDTGYYAFIDTSGGTAGRVARLESTIHTMLSMDRCLTFWYHMYGEDTGQLRVYKKNIVSQTEMMLWKLVGAQNDPLTWMYAQVPITTTGEEYMVIFEGVEGSGVLGDIAIDDVIILDDQSCGLEPTYADPTINPSTQITCNFESGFCDWIQDTDDEFDWSRRNSPTGSKYTGPDSDHTTGSGYYIYIETSSPRIEGDRAVLMTEGLPATDQNGNCFSFWYHMYGVDIEVLNIYVQVIGQSGRTMIYRREGSYSNQWNYASMTIQSENDFKIILEGVRGENIFGDIALDDIMYSVGPCAPTVGFCDFEADMCDWTAGPMGNFDWVRQNSDDAGSSSDGPTFDHTTESGTGHYVFASTSLPRNIGDSASLISSTHKPNQTGDCLQFWYHITGNGVSGQGYGSLLIYYRTNGPYNVLWSKAGDQGDIWRYGAVTINSQADYEIIFEARITQTGAGDVSLDDIEVTPGQCPPPGFCDFEEGFCSWTNPKPVEGLDDSNWLRGQGGTHTDYTGPSFDHTLGDGKGYFAFIEPNRMSNGDKAWLMSEHLNPTSGSCLTFWYHMYMNGSVSVQDVHTATADTRPCTNRTRLLQTGKNLSQHVGTAEAFITNHDVGTLNVHLYTGNAPSLLWSQTGDHGDVWLPGQIYIVSSSEYQLIFEAIRGSSSKGDTAVDDVMFTDTVCSEYDCDFEVGFCDWRQDPANDLDWLRNKGDTATDYSGPSFDHTLGTDQGYYVYIEATNQDAGDKARLISALVPSRGDGYCLQFWYHMFGSSVGELNVYIREDNGQEVMIWRRMGSQANEWRYAQRELQPSRNYEIIFEAVRATHYRSDISLDDISVTPGLCPPHFECDFDFDFCGWSNSDNSDDFDWMRGYNGTETAGTGPSIDHTTGTQTGYFAYIDTSSSRSPGDMAHLITADVTSDSEKCLRFWYHMHGSNIGTLNVYQRDIAEIFVSPVWTRSGDQGEVWRRGSVPLLPKTSGNDYQVLFEGIVGNGDRGDIAIDDVLIDNTPCQAEGWCSFEDDMCGWSNEYVKDDDYDWIRIAGSSPTSYTGPSVDHTLGTPSGYYVYIETSVGNDGNKAWLISEHLSATNTGAFTEKCFKFWYHMNGAGVNALNVYMESSTQTMTKMWAEQGDQGDVWYEGKFTVSSSQEYWVSLSNDKNCFIA